MERGVVKAGAFGRARRALRAILYCLVRGVGLFRDHKRSCPCCGFEGRFLPYGDPPRASAQCPACGSLERDRLLFDCDRATHCIGQGGKILHFAPEAIWSAGCARSPMTTALLILRLARPIWW